MKEEDYYKDDKARKWIDLVIGFFGAPFVNAILGSIIQLIVIMMERIFSSNNNETFIFLIIIPGIILLIWFNIFIIKKFKKIGRKYISKGIIIGVAVSILLPLLVFGACMLIISSNGRFL